MNKMYLYIYINTFTLLLYFTLWYLFLCRILNMFCDTNRFYLWRIIGTFKSVFFFYICTFLLHELEIIHLLQMGVSFWPTMCAYTSILCTDQGTVGAYQHTLNIGQYINISGFLINWLPVSVMIVLASQIAFRVLNQIWFCWIYVGVTQ